MDLFLKGRGVQITDQIRRVAEHKLAKLERFDPDGRRIEIEVIAERNPRIDGSHRVGVAFETLRHTFRAEGAGHDIDSALDQVVDRLEKQISTYRGKRQSRFTGRGNRVKSPRTSPLEARSSE